MIYVLTLTCQRPPETVAAALDEHRAWLRDQADQGRILLAGPSPEKGGVIITADLDPEQADERIASDPWHRDGIAAYDRAPFTPQLISPGTVTRPWAGDAVLLINVATTENAPRTVDHLARAVEHVAATAPGFLGSRLLTSVDGDAVVNLAAYTGEEPFARIFSDPGFTSRFADFAATTTGAKYRLYRTSRIITPRP